MVDANSTMAGADEIIKEIMGTKYTHHGDEHPTPPPPERITSRLTSEEPTTT